MTTNDTGETEITLPEIPKSGLFGWSRKRNKFALDEIGVFVWQLCDGAHTVQTICGKLSHEYKMHRLEAEAALTSFLQILASRDLITFKGGEK